VAINAIENESRGQEESDQVDADFQDGMRFDDDQAELEYSQETWKIMRLKVYHLSIFIFVCSC
jgi:hypothetical protein